MTMPSSPLQQRHQHGMATLAVILVLMFGLSLMVFAFAKTGLLETRMARNERDSLAVRHLAEATLELGLTTLAQRRSEPAQWQPVADRNDLHQVPAVPVTLPFARDPAEQYTATLGFLRNRDIPELVQITATTTSASGGHAQVQQLARIVDPMTQDLPPLLVDGCLSSGHGGSHLFPAAAGEPAAATTRAAGADCFALDGLHLNDGIATYDFPAGDDLWDSLFDLPRETLQERSAAEQAAVEAGELASDARSYYWVDGDHLPPFGNGEAAITLGSPDRPVWLFFTAASECPPLPGTLTLYGVIYYETGPGGACDAGDWGGATIYGSVIVAGSLVELGGASQLLHYSHADQGALGNRLPPLTALRIPGTWRDF